MMVEQKNISLKTKLFFVGFLLVITLVLIEICLRVFISFFASDNTFSKYTSMSQVIKRNRVVIYKPHRYMGLCLTPNYTKGKNRHNSLGYRGKEIDMPKPEGRFRIVCIGGSTTYTTSVQDHQLSYPALLEKGLKQKGYSNVDVVNAGVGNYSSWESLVNFQFRVLDLAPDMIIIYHGINDIHPRLVWPPEAYKGDNSGRTVPNVGLKKFPILLEHSAVLRAIYINLGGDTTLTRYSRSILNDSDTFYGLVFLNQNNKSQYPQGIFKTISADKMLATNKPIYFKRNIENIVMIAKQRGIKVLLSTFAYNKNFTHPRVASAEYQKAFVEMNDVIREIAKEQDVELFDFSNVFPANEKMYFTDGRHVNERGSQLKAKLFTNFIAKKTMVPEP